MKIDSSLFEKKSDTVAQDIEHFHIGSANPLSDFTHLITKSQSQGHHLISRAINELGVLIQRFVEEPYLHQKAITCIQGMRQLSIQYKFANEFNNYLIGLKKHHLNSTWKLLVSSEITLVSNDESSSVTVSNEMRSEFLKEMPKGETEEMAFSEDEDDDGMGVE